MVRFVVSVVILALLALVVALNQDSRADLNLLGLQLRSLPSVALALAGFAAGVLASILVYFSGLLDRKRIERLRQREQELARREQELDQRERAGAHPPPTPQVRALSPWKAFVGRLLRRPERTRTPAGESWQGVGSSGPDGPRDRPGSAPGAVGSQTPDRLRRPPDSRDSHPPQPTDGKT